MTDNAMEDLMLLRRCTNRIYRFSGGVSLSDISNASSSMEKFDKLAQFILTSYSNLDSDSSGVTSRMLKRNLNQKRMKYLRNRNYMETNRKIMCIINNPKKLLLLFKRINHIDRYLDKFGLTHKLNVIDLELKSRVNLENVLGHYYKLANTLIIEKLNNRYGLNIDIDDIDEYKPIPVEFIVRHIRNLNFERMFRLFLDFISFSNNEILEELYSDIHFSNLVTGVTVGQPIEINRSIVHSNYDTIKFLIDNKIINHSNMNWAIRCNDIYIVKALLDDNRVQFDIHEAINRATYYGHFEILKLLLEHGNYLNYSNFTINQALMTACLHENLEIVKFLLDHGVHADVNDSKALEYASQSGHLETVKLLLERGARADDRDSQALIGAIISDDIEIVRLLLEWGAQANAQNSLTLKVAMRRGYMNRNFEIANLLLAHGAQMSEIEID